MKVFDTRKKEVCYFSVESFFLGLVLSFVLTATLSITILFPIWCPNEPMMDVSYILPDHFSCDERDYEVWLSDPGI